MKRISRIRIDFFFFFLHRTRIVRRGSMIVERSNSRIVTREAFNLGPEIPHGRSRPYSKGPTAWAADGSRYENSRAIVISGPFIPTVVARAGSLLGSFGLDEDLLFLAYTREFSRKRTLWKASIRFDYKTPPDRVPSLFKARPIFRGMENRPET